MALEEQQALVLERSKEQKLYLDVQHSTDWVVVISVIASAIISFIGFLITIYVVKKSTESQIKSNEDLIKSQNEIKVKELKTLYKQRRAENLRVIICEISSYGIGFLSNAKFRYLITKNIASLDNESLKLNYHQFENSITKVLSYIRPGEVLDEQVRKELFDLLDMATQLISCILGDKDCTDQLEELEYKLGYINASLNIFLINMLNEEAA